jgi:hypothetical protein
MRIVLRQSVIIDEPPVCSLVAVYDVIFAVVAECGAGYWFAVPHRPFTLCLHDVLGSVHANASIDDAPLQVVERCVACHNADCIAEKSCSACLGMRYQRLVG